MARPESVERALLPAWFVDVLVAGVVTAIIVLGTIHMDAEAAADRPIDALAVAVAVVAGVALAGRRRWPWPVLAVVVAAAAIYTARSYPGGPIYLAGAIALYSAAIVSSRAVAYVTAAAVAIGLFTTSVVARGEVDVTDLLFFGWPAVAVLAADAVRGRRERLVAETERARHAAEQDEEERRRRMAEDRLRIARDLHDSVAHSMATINVQSGVAAHVLGRDPSQAGAALEAIRVRQPRRARRARRDPRRASRGRGCAPPTDTRPGPARRARRELAPGRASRSSCAASGSLDDVPPAVGTAAYRIVQEALTNVARHAGVGRADVALRRRDDGGLELEITRRRPGRRDVDGPAPRLVGIRARGADDRWRGHDRPRSLTVGSGSGSCGGPPVIRVVLADDQQLVRAGFRVLLDSEDGIEVVGEAGDGESAVATGPGRAPRRRADGHPHARRSTGSGRRRRSPPTPTSPTSGCSS